MFSGLQLVGAGSGQAAIVRATLALTRYDTTSFPEDAPSGRSELGAASVNGDSGGQVEIEHGQAARICGNMFAISDCQYASR